MSDDKNGIKYYESWIKLKSDYDSLKTQLDEYRAALEFYSEKKNWRDLFEGAQLPQNLKHYSVICKEDESEVSDLPGYTNFCGGQRARDVLKKFEGK